MFRGFAFLTPINNHLRLKNYGRITTTLYYLRRANVEDTHRGREKLAGSELSARESIKCFSRS